LVEILIFNQISAEVMILNNRFDEAQLDHRIGAICFNHALGLRQRVEDFGQYMADDVYNPLKTNLDSVIETLGGWRQKFVELLGEDVVNGVKGDQPFNEKFDELLREVVLKFRQTNLSTNGDGDEPTDSSEDDDAGNTAGRSSQVNPELLEKMVDAEFSTTRIAKAFRVHRNTIGRRMKAMALSGKKKRNVSDAELDELVRKLKSDASRRNAGARMIKGMSLSNIFCLNKANIM
jgi:hypothetical protein